MATNLLMTMPGQSTAVSDKLKHNYCEDDEYILNGIRFMNFRMLSSDEIQRHSVVKVANTFLYDGLTNNPSKFGLLDRKLGEYDDVNKRFLVLNFISILSTTGVGTKSLRCETCNRDYNTCVGHFGCIELAYPVYHVGFFNYTVQLLQCICKRCARILLPNESRPKYLLGISEDMNPLAKKALHKKIVAHCKKIKICPHCNFENGQIKKFPFMKIFHLIKAKETELLSSIFYEEEMNNKSERNKISIDEVENYLGNSFEFLTPHNVLKLFEKIPKSDYILLLLLDNSPMDLICTHLPVPPCIIRPSSHNNTGLRSVEDELTMKLNEILIANEALKKRIQDGSVFIKMIDAWDFLQVLVSVYFNSDVRNLPPQHNSVASGQGIAQRLKGKEGRFRANLSGKRVNYSARTVISPDPNLAIDEVGIPLKIATHMTFPVVVTPFNKKYLQQLVLNGPYQHPGAIFILNEHRKVHLNYVDRKHFASKLQYGDVVLRHMINGDYVLFNRQPSLHRLSIMCHRVRIHPDQTFKFNECVCSPYNADFDGDEMNVHFMQTEEAKAEAAILMQSKFNLTSPRNGEPVISPIQDFITSIYLMTKRDTFYSRSEFDQLIGMLLGHNDCRRKICLPKPAIIKPIPLWTGKQIVSMILKPFEDCDCRLNLRFKTKAYSHDEEFCPNEGYIWIRNSELICGTLDKSVIGGGSKKNIFYLILKEYNSNDSIDTMLRLCRVSSFYITNHGFSIGIDDVTPTHALIEQKEMLVSKGYTNVKTYIDRFNRGILNPITGLTREQTLESLILKELSEIRDHAGKACIKQLSHRNSPLVMANCGSKGSYINISQMAVCVGQQSIRSQRVPEGFNKRVLPHFDFSDRSPEARGFVANSFYSGLNPFEFFFHAMAGREGLLDTAVKTAETGYMQRRLIKGLEDLVVHYDYSVRNSDGEIIQFDYGDDCLDPINIESSDMFVDFEYYWNHILSINSYQEEPTLDSHQISCFVQKILQRKEFMDSIIPFYMEKILTFFKDKVLKKLEWLESKTNSSHDRNEHRICSGHVEAFLQRILRKLMESRIDPGTAIGAICAQSIGEPTTQMTLKTFHFAGVASMNITQGVPRITEIINATKNPSTPFIKAHLIDPTSVELAENVKLKIENVYLDQICEKIYQTFIDGFLCYILKLNQSVYKQVSEMFIVNRNNYLILILQLHLNENMVQEAINAQLKPDICKIIFPYVKIFPNVRRMIYLPRMFEDDLAKVFISGNRHVQRATIHEDGGKYYLMIEGNGFLHILGTDGVDSRLTNSNNIHEVAAVLGIEAARATIISEIKTTMKGHGITIDERHLMLLADTMTASGHVVGMTRSGFSKVKSSTIKMASVSV
ncbi:DNA-directed RNA polymerase III subunit RPC1-like protein [Euroglyphus maynei]|uniref:DNA-directed RNA polymerase subunit n=1 Tax=Euroglyphus maynei TaxID=6958 RepID=A0A1Y3AR73_EURMA|nr:DNA-directed RNA polymerase III subunit RPC1-like protein [Euroglyphus maynei]